MAERPAFIYAIHDDTETSQRLYIGVTTATVRRRLIDHINTARRGVKRPICRWITSLHERGVSPSAVVLEEVPPGGDWPEAERFWIASFRAMGVALLNLADGGQGRPGWKMPDATKAKIGRANMGNKNFQGRTHTPEVRAQMRARMLARPMTPEARKKGSESLRGRRLSPEHIAKVAANNRGRKLSAESRAKISAARTGKPLSAVQLAAVLESAKQRVGQPAPKVRSHSKTGFKGVTKSAGTKSSYFARLVIGGVRRHLGSYRSAEEAARAYDRAAREILGERAVLNFPDDPEQ